jgi:integrase
VVQDKTGAELYIPIHPALGRSLKAGPALGDHLITDRKGGPIKGEWLSIMIVRAVGAAGLPRRCVPHGLRKAALRRLAEYGSTSKQIAAVSGHRSLGEIERYTKRADQVVLARAAIKLLPDKG